MSRGSRLAALGGISSPPHRPHGTEAQAGSRCMGWRSTFRDWAGDHGIARKSVTPIFASEMAGSRARWARRAAALERRNQRPVAAPKSNWLMSWAMRQNRLTGERARSAYKSGAISTWRFRSAAIASLAANPVAVGRTCQIVSSATFAAPGSRTWRDLAADWQERARRRSLRLKLILQDSRSHNG